jgi:hypothetical protein
VSPAEQAVREAVIAACRTGRDQERVYWYGALNCLLTIKAEPQSKPSLPVRVRRRKRRVRRSG